MGELPRNPESIRLWIVRAIQASQPAAGLAILIGRASSGVPFKGDSEITHDLHALGRAFDELRFTVLNLLNPSKAQLAAVIKSVLNLKKCGIEWPSSWRRIIVAYSGAGPEIASEKGKDPVDIECIVQDFLNSDQKQLKSIPKIFFMDFNRGFIGDKGVEITTDASSFQVDATSHTLVGVSNTFQNCQGELASRGNSRIPSKGNYLLAYSAQKNMQSCSAQGGSYWIQTLSKFLVDKNLIDLDVENILKRVNIYLIKNVDSLQMHFLQQPEYISALNEDVKLLKEAKEMLRPQLQQFQPPQELMQHQQQPQMPQYLQQHQQQQSMQHHQQPQMRQYQQQRQQQQLMQHQEQPQMPQYQQQQQHQQLMQQQQLIEDQQLQFVHHQYQGQIPEDQQPELRQNDLLGLDISDHDLQAILNGTELENAFDGLDLNSLNGHQSVQQPQHIAYPIPHQPVYDGQYSYEINSLELHGRGEETAKDDLKDDSTGAVKSIKSSKGEKPSKTPKTILKEYFEGKFKDKVKVEYKTTESTGGFTSTVIGPEFGCVKGDTQPTKKEAENSAASKALSKLN